MYFVQSEFLILIFYDVSKSTGKVKVRKSDDKARPSQKPARTDSICSQIHTVTITSLPVWQEVGKQKNFYCVIKD